ncbi:hypothetical protein CAAN1_42S00100 [[Candida] anglica]|uniref:Uncharacterized protein n=1 Tax=[Candida] anglica TaxID=148631 RepID=A0ABP0ELY3_9ASCO
MHPLGLLRSCVGGSGVYLYGWTTSCSLDPHITSFPMIAQMCVLHIKHQKVSG